MKPIRAAQNPCLYAAVPQGRRHSVSVLGKKSQKTTNYERLLNIDVRIIYTVFIQDSLDKYGHYAGGFHYRRRGNLQFLDIVYN